MKTKIVKYLVGTIASLLILVGGLFLIPMYYIFKASNPKYVLVAGISCVVSGAVILVALKFYNLTKYN